MKEVNFPSFRKYVKILPVYKTIVAVLRQIDADNQRIGRINGCPERTILKNSLPLLRFFYLHLFCNIGENRLDDFLPIAIDNPAHCNIDPGLFRRSFLIHSRW